MKSSSIVGSLLYSRDFIIGDRSEYFPLDTQAGEVVAPQLIAK
jgi:hypothetical protein